MHTGGVNDLARRCATGVVGALVLAAGTLVGTQGEAPLGISPAQAARPGPAHPCGVVKKPPRRWAHVVWIIVENQSSASLTDPGLAPYLASISAGCGVATNVHAVTHPSLPNYIALTAGSTLGIDDSGPPSQNAVSARNVFSQLGPRGWRAYSQSMPTRCHRENAGRYAVRHNPPTYYRNLEAICRRRDVPLGSRIDLSARLTLIIPDLVDGMHDSDVTTGDTYLSTLVPRLLRTPEYRAGNTAIFITADEDDGTAGNVVATFVIAPSVRSGTRTSAQFTHYSLLKTTEQMLGVRQLRNAKNARSMRQAFNLRRR